MRMSELDDSTTYPCSIVDCPNTATNFITEPTLNGWDDDDNDDDSPPQMIGLCKKHRDQHFLNTFGRVPPDPNDQEEPKAGLFPLADPYG